MRSGQLAKLAGVSTDTLRHYERVGVLPRPPRTSGGYRAYPATAVQRLRLIRRALSLGFSLPELAGILKVREAGGSPCHQVRQMAGEKLERIERQIGELAAARDQMRELLAEWDQRLQQTPANAQARLLENP